MQNLSDVFCCGVFTVNGVQDLSILGKENKIKNRKKSREKITSSSHSIRRKPRSKKKKKPKSLNHLAK
jgi:hypothetical protein